MRITLVLPRFPDNNNSLLVKELVLLISFLRSLSSSRGLHFFNIFISSEQASLDTSAKLPVNSTVN